MNNTLFKFYRFSLSKWKLIPQLDRWIFCQLIPPFLFSISSLTIVSLSIGVMFELVGLIVDTGLPLTIAFQILLLKIPNFIIISFPISILMSTLYTYSRLSSYSEIKALMSIGISLKRIIISGIILGIFMTLFTFFSNDYIVPYANQRADYLLTKGLKLSIKTNSVKNILYPRYGTIIDPENGETKEGITHIFYAGELDQRTMADVTLLDFSQSGYLQMLFAKNALWNNLKGYWEFNEGDLYTLSPEGTPTSIEFSKYSYPLDSEINNKTKIQKDASKMSTREAYKALAKLEVIGNSKDVRRLKVRIQEKYSFPLACVVFSLIGSGIGCKLSTTNSNGLAFGFTLFLIFIYYLISFGFSSLGVSGLLSPFSAAWIPVLISLVGGVLLIRESNT